jgi:hypothetical protein
MPPYDKSKGPKEGKSAISSKLRQKLYGNQLIYNNPVPNFADWYSQQQKGPVQQPQPQEGININTTPQQVGTLPQTQAQPQQPPSTYQLGNGKDFGGMDQQQFMRMLVDRFGPQMMQQQQYALETQRGAQVRPAEQFEAAARAQDPLRYTQQNEAARMAQSPWAPGGQFQGHRAEDIYTPEEILASQGNTAQNQILRNRMPVSADRRAQLAGVPANQRANAGEFDPEELLRQNRIYSANRSYM